MRKIVLFLVLLWTFVSASASYTNSADFLKAEWNTCKVATDWCNTITIDNGKLWASTMMYCEDIYWSWWQEKWSCKDENLVWNDKDAHGCIPSAWYSWDESKNMCVRPWEEEPKICTMEYAPMCWVDWVTYGNSCMAWKKEIAYTWECDKHIDAVKLKKYQKTAKKYDRILAKASDEKLAKAIEKVNQIIEKTKLTKMTDEAIKEVVTKYTFIKELFQNALAKR